MELCAMCNASIMLVERASGGGFTYVHIEPTEFMHAAEPTY